MNSITYTYTYYTYTRTWHAHDSLLLLDDKPHTYVAYNECIVHLRYCTPKSKPRPMYCRALRHLLNYN